MATKVPEKQFMAKFLDLLQAADWAKKKDNDGQDVLAMSPHNTAIVMRALVQAAREGGYIALMLTIAAACEYEREEVAVPA